MSKNNTNVIAKTQKQYASPEDFIETVTEWSIEPKNLHNIYNKVFYDLTTEQHNCFWNERTINTECDNFIIYLAALDEYCPGVFLTISTILSLLPHLDHVIENKLGDRLNTSMPSSGLHLWCGPEYDIALTVQKMMENIHERAYTANLTSACQLNWQKLCIYKDNETLKDKFPAKLNLRPALIAFLQKNSNMPIETTLAILKNGYDGALNKTEKLLINKHECTMLDRLWHGLNVIISFIKMEWLLLPHLIWTLFRVDMMPLHNKICQEHVYNMINYIKLCVDNKQYHSADPNIISELIKPTQNNNNNSNINDDTLNHIQINLAGIRITNNEILRDEFIHVEISLKTCNILIDKILKHHHVSKNVILEYIEEMIYDQLFHAICDVIVYISAPMSTPMFTEKDLQNHLHYLMDAALIVPICEKLGLSHIPTVPNHITFDYRSFVQHRTFTSQHEVKSSSYTNTLPGFMTSATHA